jgi:hypothetical protein
MGADGGITIYPVEFIRNKFGDEKTDKFLKLIRDSLTYTHDFTTPNGEKIPVITKYRGDNIYSESILDRIEVHIWPNKWQETLTINDMEYIKECGLTLEEIIYIVKHMNETPKDYWEVWT